MRKFIISFCCYVFFIFTLAAQDKAPHYTVIVSLDAFRWDYPAMYDTPNLNQMAREGVKATMLPSYPASTFPNTIHWLRDWCLTTTVLSTTLSGM